MPLGAGGPGGPGRSLLSGVLCGVGLTAFVDEVVFHQLLHWHHFYDRSTPDVALVSDGVFHAAGWVAVVAGLFLFADLQRRAARDTGRLVAGVLLGAGGFQLYDGVVQHRLLGLHQVRYGVDLLPYDLAWNGAGAAVLVAGVVLLLVARSRTVPRAA